ncbi:hypothetical protein A1A1_12112 [Planococcus antarcticus DSM 14505]|uniref:Siderophore biosynthesis protein n=1 Tax=Planococcus antarcticus DSM 14505 TaxID=1185653 RepID=A0A1C7DDG6_9BACL|nr:IucA/IucC family protein [Planococcus antarcticus]ANU09526.1 hypothetical protein BBH88_03995 [Planococcus antarcticus DSM 14505]EIM06307.1 hypothetical protein A1A1_12112 [Planococcus antarcticus DSM 14505]
MNHLLVQRSSEIEVIKELEKGHPAVSRAFKRNLPQSKKRVLHQLIQAILRENFLPSSWIKEGNKQQVTMLVPSGGKLTVAIEKRYMLGHMEIGEDILYGKEGSTRKIDHPADFAHLLKLQQEENGFTIELENSVVNYALSLTAAELRKEKFIWSGDTFSFLLAEMKKNACFSPLVFGEQWVIDGHTLHPCTKTKLGLTAQEVIKFSPEWGANANLIPVAIHKNLASMNSNGKETMTDILLREYPNLSTVFKERLPNRGKDYEVIPVHPWQLKHTLKPYLEKEIAQTLILPLENVHIPASALLSVRSLAPHGSKTLHHIKTALNVQMTSAKRTVSPASIKNGPVISAILKKIETIDPLVGNSYRFLSESAGGHYLSLQNDKDLFLKKNLSALLRENPEKNLSESEIALPAAFLISRSPFTGKLILLELVENYSKTNEIDINKAAVKYICTYAELLLPGLITLISKYGISLEAHLQNTVPVFKDGMPVRFLFRDNGGIRIKEDRFNLFGWGYAIDNDTNLLTDNEQDLFNMFSHALLHNHLGEMIFFLSKELQIEEEMLWKPIRGVVHSTIFILKNQGNCQQAVLLLEEKLFAPLAPLKSLVKMRLTNQFTENAYTLISNPLADVKKGDEDNGL